MSYVMSGLVLALVGTFILAAAGALRSGHLLFLYVRSGDHIFLERGADGKYAVVRARHLSAAVARFARMRTAAAVEAARKRVDRHLPGHAGRELHRGGRARAAHV
jgi:hypothetical protein